jgi:UDPglucose--hexose-1-phosphate uridylyltransferase
MRSAKSFAELNQKERYSLARALKTVLMKYDGLWQRPFPYLMLIHQAPTDGREHAEYHAYIELCPAYRSSDKLKFLAGTELGAGMFANDSIPEQKAGELRAIEVRL